MTNRPLLPLPDYQRIYQVAYSVLEASSIAMTHRSCLFFASVGVLLLREQYRLEATLSVGCMALMVDETSANVAVYGSVVDGDLMSEDNAFHAWVECDGWLIDFMAPILGDSMRADGCEWHIPRRMLQKPLSERQDSIHAIQHVGEFFCRHDSALAEQLLDRQGVQFEDLVRACKAWFRKPPKPLPAMMLADTHAPSRNLVLRAPAVEGVW